MFGEAAQRQFETQGYLRLPGLIAPDMLARLDTLFDTLLEPDGDPAKAVQASPTGPVVTNVSGLCNRGNLAALELLALPEVMKVATAICGEDVFLLQEFAVIKHRGDGNPVLWHQDMVHNRTAPCVAFGIYLDDADPGEGALRVVPGSHLSDRPIAELAHEPAVEVPMKAGDVLIHDMMLAHSSEPMEGNSLRRVIYLEFLSTRLALGEEIYPRAVVDNRTRLSFAARRFRREARPNGACFKPRQRDPSSRDRRRDLHEVLAEIYAMPTHPRPANYCFERIPANLA
ncbi:phytanoyl-CoA dioxygenase family protein [Sphingorhabdus soli]|uniref:Phytanoyl-CoA dioxygenase family protein n=1 Tax=Flavisphingopyxis soli TaxID=2601267 RepID=A0A5C6U8N0_9SPHN|nr:phytanoyl-CoA dioxygenase family protein [Sphingorhabdus soli]TXC69222.1 phytanoyl-CoA dioxygenase family protein [Sphingorhabdus soli]